MQSRHAIPAAHPGRPRGLGSSGGHRQDDLLEDDILRQTIDVARGTRRGLEAHVVHLRRRTPLPIRQGGCQDPAPCSQEGPTEKRAVGGVVEGLSLTDHAQSSDGYSSAKKAKNMSKYIRAVAGVSLFVAVHVVVLVCTWGFWRGFRGGCFTANVICSLGRTFNTQLRFLGSTLLPTPISVFVSSLRSDVCNKRTEWISYESPIVYACTMRRHALLYIAAPNDVSPDWRQRRDLTVGRWDFLPEQDDACRTKRSPDSVNVTVTGVDTFGRPKRRRKVCSRRLFSAQTAESR